MYFDQREFDLKCEWGLEGLRTLQAVSDVIVIVDVLSFSTAVDIAVSRGAAVLPYRWKDESARQFAAENGAILAGARGVDEYTLSPASLRTIPARSLLVLPSPNGSTLSLHAAGLPTFTACLRNALAVARQVTACGSRIAVIPAGEHWRDGSLRPCLEDLIGAGAVLSELPGTFSPEAETAIGVFKSFRGKLSDAISRCGSGMELVERGFASDVDLAVEYGVSSTAPLLINGRFMNRP